LGNARGQRELEVVHRPERPRDDLVHVDGARQMVALVLKDAREPPTCLDGELLPGPVQAGDFDLQVPFHEAPVPADTAPAEAESLDASLVEIVSTRLTVPKQVERCPLKFVSEVRPETSTSSCQFTEAW
jgi:hypothetical protein